MPNIPFTVHNNVNTNRPSTTLYAIISTTPFFLNNYAIDSILQESFDDQEELERDDTVKLDINFEIVKEPNITDCCSICHNSYSVEDKITRLACGHLFHYNCIKEWGYYNPSCPLCKISIPTVTQPRVTQ